MHAKKVASIVFFVLAGIVLVLGIIQLVLFIPPQLSMLASATSQGATQQQVSDYFQQTFLPQVISYAITTLGFASAIAAGATMLLLSSRKHGGKHHGRDASPVSPFGDEALAHEEGQQDSSFDNFGFGDDDDAQDVPINFRDLEDPKPGLWAPQDVVSAVKAMQDTAPENADQEGIATDESKKATEASPDAEAERDDTTEGA
ncbi:MAG: hypothetical protein FWD72_04550 [Eggerthellaceae bacterium]|nr:hypothetical protein [Eggerthellaceae bacterium]